MRRSIRRLLVPVVLGSALVSTGHELAAADTAPGVALARWFGAEGGWDETASVTVGAGCPGWCTSRYGTAGIGTSESKREWSDPDGVLRAWPARTGRFFYILGVGGSTPLAGDVLSNTKVFKQAPSVGGAASHAYLSTPGGFAGGTVSFAFRIHTLPEEPVVIYRHQDPAFLKTLSLTLKPDGGAVSVVASGLGMAAETGAIATQAWHTVSLSYGVSPGPFTLHLDGALEAENLLPQGGPDGNVSIGIVHPMMSEFTIGLDDYVESPELNAPIGGARINYLIPLGTAGAAQWQKQEGYAPCRDAAENWQFVSEDQWVQTYDPPVKCAIHGTGVGASAPNLVDEYTTEGIPSAHQSTSNRRDLMLQPRVGEPVLGVRLRMRGIIQYDSPLVYETWYLGFVDDGVLVEDSFSFNNGGTGGAQTHWGPTHVRRPNGEPWDASSLGAATLRLDSGSAPISHRSTTGVRLDYVWVPNA